VDNVDLAAAREKGIVVTNTPGANTASVADLTVGLMLSLARSIPMADGATKAGEWPRMRGLTLEGKVVGLIGFGSIGKLVARRLTGFDCAILAYDPVPDSEYAKSLGIRLCPRDEVIREAEFLSLHCPLLPETREMVNAGFLSQMRTGAFLVNTSRGEMVDEAALLGALESGHLRGAALDVFARQPPGADNALLPCRRSLPHRTWARTRMALPMRWDGERSTIAWPFCVGRSRSTRYSRFLYDTGDG
jgi:D-3-phosphoglycerate dehydrogenase